MKLNKLTKSRIVCAVVSLVLAATLAFYLLPSLYGDQRATRTVLKINREVSAGTEITAAMVNKKEVGSYGLDSSVLTESGSVVGKVCKRDLTRHDLLYPEDFCKASEYKKLGGINSYLLKDGDVLVSVTTKTPAAAVAGQITSGDVVDVCIAHKSQVTDIMGNSKTSVAAELAMALSQADSTVCLISSKDILDFLTGLDKTVVIVSHGLPTSFSRGCPARDIHMTTPLWRTSLVH